jgi:hypothetical protein
MDVKDEGVALLQFGTYSIYCGWARDRISFFSKNDHTGYCRDTQVYDVTSAVCLGLSFLGFLYQFYELKKETKKVVWEPLRRMRNSGRKAKENV